MNILLLGLKGAGKTSIGKQVASELNYKFIELDQLVLENTGYSTIHEVYDHKLSLWKECELEVSKDLSLEDDVVIACGGGFVENELNITYFREHTSNLKIVYLCTKPETLAKRLVGEDSEKKAIKEGSIQTTYYKRDFLYRLHADIVIETDKRTIKEIKNKLLKLLKEVDSKS